MEARSEKIFLKAQPGIEVFHSDSSVLNYPGVLDRPGTGELGNRLERLWKTVSQIRPDQLC